MRVIVGCWVLRRLGRRDGVLEVARRFEHGSKLRRLIEVVERRPVLLRSSGRGAFAGVPTPR